MARVVVVVGRGNRGGKVYVRMSMEGMVCEILSYREMYHLGFSWYNSILASSLLLHLALAMWFVWT